MQAFAISILKRQYHKNTFKALKLPLPKNQDFLHEKILWKQQHRIVVNFNNGKDCLCFNLACKNA